MPSDIEARFFLSRIFKTSPYARWLALSWRVMDWRIDFPDGAMTDEQQAAYNRRIRRGWRKVVLAVGTMLDCADVGWHWSEVQNETAERSRL